MDSNTENKKVTALDDSHLEELNRQLYERKRPDVEDMRHRFRVEESRVPHAWQSPTMDDNHTQHIPRRPKTIRNIFLVAGGIFLASVAFMFISLSLGRNAVSNDNIALDVSAKTFVDGGEDIDYTIALTNGNSVPLELVDLVIEYTTSTPVAGVVPQKESIRKSIGTVLPRQRLIESFDISLFGEEGEERDILARLEYRVPESTSIFTKETSFRVGIRSAPLIIDITAPDRIVHNQTITYTLNVRSNALTRIANAAIQVEMPSGFQFIESEPASSVGKNIWILGDIEPADTRTVAITGRLTGEASNQKTIIARVGTLDSATGNSLVTTYSSHTHGVVLEAPFINAYFTINRSNEPVVALNTGSSVEGIIAWQNTLPVRLNDVRIIVELEGSIFDASKVNARDGRYDSNTKSMTWNQDTEAELVRVEPNASNTVGFSFPTQIASSAGTGVQSPEMSLRLSIRATGDDGVIYTAEDIDSVRILLNSSATLDQKTLHSSGPLANSGPIPPAVGKTTTYTLQLTIHNSSNKLTKGRLEAKLPTGITWLNRTAPASQKVNYNTESRTIVWDIGDLAPGTGFTANPKELYLQVGVTPSISDLGNKMKLLSDIVFTATDSFTGSDIRITRLEHTNQLKGDSIENNGAVVE